MACFISKRNERTDTNALTKLRKRLLLKAKRKADRDVNNTMVSMLGMLLMDDKYPTN